jgi:hypothetical protein
MATVHFALRERWNMGQGHGAGKYALELEGKHAGWLESVTGTSGRASVTSLGTGMSREPHVLTDPLGKELTLTCGAGMSREFFQWIHDSSMRAYLPHNGAVVAADFHNKEINRQAFASAFISEIGFPACDAASKDAAKMTIKLIPEFVPIHPPGTTTKPPTTGGTIIDKPGRHKPWLASNFRVKIDGLDHACMKIIKVDPLTITVRHAVEVTPGRLRVYQHVPAQVEMPNLAITLPDSAAEDFMKWHKSFAIDGNHSAGQEKSGTLEYLTPNMKETLFTLTFDHLGIFSLTVDKAAAHGGHIRHVKFEMYCEQIHFDYKPGSYS